MSRFQLIEIEKEKSKTFPNYEILDLDRETEYKVYELREDEYGNKDSRLLMTTPNITYAKKFLRSCRLIDGIIIEEKYK